MILVTGATGNVGAELVRTLTDTGESVRALVRRQDTALPEGVDAAVGDLNEPDTLTAAMNGVRAVFLLPGYRDMPGVLSVAKQAGVDTVVQLSGTSAASGDMTNAITRYMATTEQAVRESGIAWTILRPSAYMTNALRWIPQLTTGDVVRAPFPQVRTASLDPADLAAVAARALVDDKYHGEILWPTGPEALLPSDQVAALATALGRDLRCEGLTDEQARTEMLADTPVEYVDAFFDFYVTGNLDESVVRSTVQDVTGKPPSTFAQWATAHVDAFR